MVRCLFLPVFQTPPLFFYFFKFTPEVNEKNLTLYKKTLKKMSESPFVSLIFFSYFYF